MEKDNAAYRILVIEDNPGDALLIQDYLQEMISSPKIQHAKNFLTAKKILEDADMQFDIVFLDLTLPDHSGEDLIKDVVVRSKESPVIVLTGLSDFEFSVRSIRLGISDYLLKDDLNPSVLHKSVLYNLERRKSVSELQESEKRYSDLFHLSPEPMWVYDLETYDFLDVNEAARQHYGYSEAEFLGMKITQIRPESEVQALINTIKTRSASPEKFSRGIYMHKKKNGEIITVDVHSNRITFKGRRAEVILANDITERLNYIRAIEEQNEKLKEIAWFQSHVVRAPLARIMGLIDLLRETDDIDKSRVLDYIVKSADELDEIIRNIIQKSAEVKPNKAENKNFDQSKIIP